MSYSKNKTRFMQQIAKHNRINTSAYRSKNFVFIGKQLFFFNEFFKLAEHYFLLSFLKFLEGKDF
jgi:hypothetical protein